MLGAGENQGEDQHQGEDQYWGELAHVEIHLYMGLDKTTPATQRIRHMRVAINQGPKKH